MSPAKKKPAKKKKSYRAVVRVVTADGTAILPGEDCGGLDDRDVKWLAAAGRIEAVT